MSRGFGRIGRAIVAALPVGEARSLNTLQLVALAYGVRGTAVTRSQLVAARRAMHNVNVQDPGLRLIQGNYHHDQLVLVRTPPKPKPPKKPAIKPQQ